MFNVRQFLLQYSDLKVPALPATIILFSPHQSSPLLPKCCNAPTVVECSGHAKASVNIPPLRFLAHITDDLCGLVIDIDRESYRKREHRGNEAILLIETGGCYRLRWEMMDHLMENYHENP